ncbi:MAG: GNAT family N-acetyltransferase, partial [Bacteroidia bacterium]
MKLFEVNSRLLSKEFTRVPKIIYMNDPVWVCPLDRDIDSIFEPSKNAYFKHGDATRWILRDSSGRLIGRVAAFIDFNTSSTWDQPTGGMGFFECIDSPEAAFMLFDAARNWLTERGMEAMDGPINFGETDKYWGLLVDGFTHPTFEVAYNPPYYIKLFESYGFKKFYGMTGFLFDIKAGAPERFRKIAEWITRKPDYEFRHFRWDRANEMMDDFAEVFNQAWASFKKDNFEPLTRDYIMGTLKKARIIIDVEFIWIAYFKKRPVAIFMLYPDA